VSRQNPKLETVSYAKTKHQNKKNRTDLELFAMVVANNLAAKSPTSSEKLVHFLLVLVLLFVCWFSSAIFVCV
jgi:hypothetical protein